MQFIGKRHDIYRWLILTLILGTWMPAGASEAGLCHEEWETLLQDQQSSTMDMKIQYWKSLGKKCGGSGLYEFRMGHLYTRGGKLEQAESVFDEGLKKSTKYKKELLAGKADLALKQRDYTKAEKQYNEIIQNYPEWYNGYQGLGTIKLIQHNFNEAVKYLSEANKREEDPVTYRQLVIAYNQLGQHDNAVMSLDRAYRLDESIQADRDAMVAAAVSYVKIGKYKVADGILMMLLNSNPAVRNDPEFLNIAAFVSKKLQEGN